MRFGTLVQSPLRAGLLRFLHARPMESFDIEALTANFGRLRLDVDNCLGELVSFNLAQRAHGTPPRYLSARPARQDVARLLEAFLERRATISSEDQAPSVQRFREMIGRDEKMLVVFEWIRTAAKSDIPVVILGPAGSGAEIVARMIHELSRRTREAFQAVNCAALTVTLFDSEMFGYEHAMAGTNHRRPGRFELADRGTLFLDDVGDLPPAAQSKLLRVLQEGQFKRLGGEAAVYADVRVISAASRPLDELVRDTRFRDDLHSRLNAFSIRLPSLRERPVDIPVLANRFLVRYCATSGLPIDGKTFSPEATARLQAYAWPGNVRELESTVSRAALSAPGRVIRDADIDFLHPHVPTDTDGTRRLPTLRESERAHILRVLDAVSWNKKEAAHVLEISRGTLYRKIDEYGLSDVVRLSRNRARTQ
jgi:DNA-binding NtrC family response regulator